MKEHSDIAHLGLNFWRKLVAKYPHYFQVSNDNAFLLCLDDEGHLLDYFPFSNRISRTSVVVKAYLKLEAYSKSLTLVRIQSQPALQKDPFEIGKTHTMALYDAASRYGFHLVEVIIPRIS